MSNVSFDVPADVAKQIDAAVRRYIRLSRHVTDELGQDDLLSLEMDLFACHANGCPIDWRKLNDADTFTFLHDVNGIRRHINRKTGKLENCFLPRCAEKPI